MHIFSIQNKLEKKVTAVISHQGPHPFSPLASGLSALSWLYGAVMRIRRIFYRRGVFPSSRLPCYVISVGNLCLGGTGKTPMVLDLALLLNEIGYKPAVISRGYKGLSEKQGAVVSDGRTLLQDARHSGDEPFLLANYLRGVPVVVGKNRVLAGQTALQRFQIDVLVLDDGFQHLNLQRDLNLLLLDARNPFGNSFVLPRGVLREPKSALSDADAVIMTRFDDAAHSICHELARQVSPRPFFRAMHRSVMRAILPAWKSPDRRCLTWSNPLDPDSLSGKRVFAFSGLAHNDAFWEGLSKSGARLTGKLGFQDHHPYDMIDVKRIDRAARSAGSTVLVTTDKDFVRLPAKVRFSLDLIVMGIRVDFGEEQERWRRFIATRIESRMADRR